MVVILALFLFDWRSALISVVTIPLSLMAAALVLYARGTTINTMVLAGFVIALGAIVDDAIVDVENIVRRLRLAASRAAPQSKASIILESSLEVRGAVVYASLIEAWRCCRSSSSTASPGRSSARWPSPTRWPSSSRWWWP